MITVYSKSSCPQCEQAKNILKSYNIDYNEVRVDQDPTAREFLLQEGHRSVPQIYNGSKIFIAGGAQGLMKLNERELKELVNAL